MKKVFIVVDACSGEDYSADDPTVLFVSESPNDARVFFNDEISNWEDGMTDYDSEVTEYVDQVVYECTDYEGDSHRILKMVPMEVCE